MAFLTRHHFERYPRSKMAHFLNHFWSPPECQIRPAIWIISILDYLPNWAIFGDKWIGRDFLRISVRVLVKLTFLTRHHFERYVRTKMANFCTILCLLLRARFFHDMGNFEPRLAAKFGHFLATNGLAVIVSKFCNRYGEMPPLESQISPRFGKFWAVISWKPKARNRHITRTISS